MSSTTDIWAVVPIKELDGAKQRLAPLLSPAQRRALIEVMMGEVLEAVAGAKSLAGILVVTLAPEAAAVASDRKSTRLNSSHLRRSRMPSSA